MKNTNCQILPHGRSTEEKQAGLSLPTTNYSKFRNCDMKIKDRCISIRLCFFEINSFSDGFPCAMRVRKIPI